MLNDPIILVLVCALATYATRMAGFVVIQQFGQIHYRIEAALDAVPTAVLAALVAPSIVTKGPAEAIAIAVAAYFASRFSMPVVVLLGLIAVVVFRALLN